MQRSSESIAQLAAALAKAQGELINPEKSLTATIKTDGAAKQIFRYAPLSSGLEIVRRTLGQHEIAVVQTTSTDPAAGMINLTTMRRTRPENGSPPSGRSAPSLKRRHRVASGRHLPMHAAMPFSPWSGLQARTIWTRLILPHPAARHDWPSALLETARTG